MNCCVQSFFLEVKQLAFFSHCFTQNLMFPVTSFLFGFIFKIVKGMISCFPYFASINRTQSSRIVILNALNLQWSELPTRGQCSVYLKQNRQKKDKLQSPTNSINSEWLKCLSFSTFNSNFFSVFYRIKRLKSSLRSVMNWSPNWEQNRTPFIKLCGS